MRAYKPVADLQWYGQDLPKCRTFPPLVVGIGLLLESLAVITIDLSRSCNVPAPNQPS
jgi:hypothetical protein